MAAMAPVFTSSCSHMLRQEAKERLAEGQPGTRGQWRNEGTRKLFSKVCHWNKKRKSFSEAFLANSLQSYLLELDHMVTLSCKGDREGNAPW